MTRDFTRLIYHTTVIYLPRISLLDLSHIILHTSTSRPTECLHTTPQEGSARVASTLLLIVSHMHSSWTTYGARKRGRIAHEGAQRAHGPR